MPFLPPSPNESDEVSLELILSQTHRIQQLEAVLEMQECPHCGTRYGNPDTTRMYPACRVCIPIRALLAEGK